MTNASQTLGDPRAGPDTAPLRAKWGWIVALGVVYTVAGFGLLGYLFVKLGCEPAPLLLGFILGPLMEENLRRAMRISGGDPMIFLERPISLGLLIAGALLLFLVALPFIRGKREEVFQES